MVLTAGYDGLPYYLKSCFMYLSIFLEGRNVKRGRLVNRWVAEGYSRDTFEADRYFMELEGRSMILATQQSSYCTKRFDSCKLHGLIREVCIAKATEEDLVLRLEEGCSSSTHGVVRHLAISDNWEGDGRELESTADQSRIRSLTVFGKCRPFYISDKMRFLRVLDLEETYGLADHHLEHVGKLFLLRFLSLRGCGSITRLPDSVGNLRQLETLDIKRTKIPMLPRTITKLSKLRFLKAGSAFMKQPRNHGGCAPFSCRVREGATEHYGVNVCLGTGKLKTLHTLHSMHLAWDNAIVREIKGLTGLRKLGVSGITTRNGSHFCSAISSLSRLESLSVWSEEGDLFDCLHTMPSPPENLEILKLCGRLNRLPEWIKGLRNLVKLKLEGAELPGNAETMRALGNLPKLSILCLQVKSFEGQGPITLQGAAAPASGEPFRNLRVLQLWLTEVEVDSLEFEPASMPALEVLNLRLVNSKTGSFPGLELLPSIKQVRLDVMVFLNYLKNYLGMSEDEAQVKAGLMMERAKKNIREQLTANKNRPVLTL